MTPQDILAIEHACEKLCRQFANLSDESAYPEICALFTPDGIYCRPSVPDTEIRGREALHEAFLKRPPLVIRHIVSNCVIDVVSATEASGFSYIQYLAAPDKGSDRPVEAGPFHIGEFRDRFVLTEAGWRFSERRGQLALTR